MKKIILTILLAALIGIGIIVSPLKINKDIKPKSTETPVAITLTPKEFLKSEINRQGLTDRDFLIMVEIIQCESGWAHFWETGEVKVSNGNIGLAQINKWAHQKEYTELGLDPFKEFDNLKYAVILYKRGGITAWKQWSGNCFLPKIEMF